MTASSWDDYPIHQTSEYIRHPATSDRNFYDRYYFNLHGSSDELFAIFGLGQYPNLGVTDAFLAVRMGDKQYALRASAELSDRMDTRVGPLGVEVIDPLQRLRFVADGDHTLAIDAVWEGSIPVFSEPRQYLRSRGKVVFDTQRFAQTGRWSGSITVAGETIALTPDRWWGNRDRSWGVRPVGEPEPDGIRQDVNVMSGMWNYFPMQFDDHAILYLCHERDDGTRRLEEAVRVWSDPAQEPEWLGRPEHRHELRSGTRLIDRSTIVLPDAPEGKIEITATTLLAHYLGYGSGYGLEPDWRHGMYQGRLEVQEREYDVAEIHGIGQYGVVDSVARFEYGDAVGHGLLEAGFFGPFNAYGLTDRGALAP